MTEPWRLDAGLQGKAAIVTGAAGGVGRATAAILAASGVDVFGVDRDEGGLRETIAGLDAGRRHDSQAFDLAQVGGIDALVAQACAALGRLDILVHSAAVIRRQPLLEVTEADWDLQHSVNLKATFFLNRAAGEVMKRQGEGGRIVNFTSGAWQDGGGQGSHAYASSKGGVVTLTRRFARTYGADGILVNVISPGQIDTPMQYGDNPPEVVRAGIERCPLGRMGQPEEVAAVAVFLVSRHSSFMTGATVTVSGGGSLW